MGTAAETLRHWLAHPLTRGLDLDDPRTTALRRDIIRGKPFLRRIYHEWYTAQAAHVPAGDEPALEIGSGAGFLREYVPGLVTSDVFECPGVERVIDARELPFASGGLRSILMLNVLHHIPQVERFFAEAVRCLRPGGTVVMIEPWITAWSRFVYTTLHHEPFDTARPTWDFAASGPLSSSNGALPWIIFQRDRATFTQRFPQLRVVLVRPMMPLRYVVSGGISLRSLVPGWSYAAWRGLEGLLSPLNRWLAMFALVVLVRHDRAT